jgi:dynein heavy chain 2
MEDAIYGGRVDNAYDLRVLRSYLGVFFSNKLATDKGAGMEVLPGTPLRMPNTPDYKSFRKIIAQLSDTDAPCVFSLPDNIERSLQRTLSTAVISQLRALATFTSEVSKFDREKWRIQVRVNIMCFFILYIFNVVFVLCI